MAQKFVHERGILCAELVVAQKFVHEMGILCTKLLLDADVLQFDAFADKPFFFDGLKYLREGYKKVGGTFDGIVENDNGTRLNVWDYVAGAGLAADVAVVVPADDVPHDCVVPFMQHTGLVGANAGIRWTEQIGFYHVSGNVYVPYIVSGLHAPSLYVAV